MAAGAKLGIKLMTVVIGIPVSILTRKAVEKAWAAARPDDPPRKAAEADVQWADAVAWAALSAVGIVVGELITRRSAEAAYRVITGNEPPAPKATKDAKRLAKASEKAGATAD